MTNLMMSSNIELLDQKHESTEEILRCDNIFQTDLEQCDENCRKSDRDIWNEIVKESDDKRQEIEGYLSSKYPVLEASPHPVVDYLDTYVFPVLNESLIKMLKKIKDQETQIFTEGDTYLNSLNFISEYLWNMNPMHPERQKKWTNISNIAWS